MDPLTIGRSRQLGASRTDGADKEMLGAVGNDWDEVEPEPLRDGEVVEEAVTKARSARLRECWSVVLRLAASPSKDDHANLHSILFTTSVDAPPVLTRAAPQAP
jgi:hypothetical protein